MPSIYDAISNSFLILAFLAAMVAIPWVGQAVEDRFLDSPNDDEDPDAHT